MRVGAIFGKEGGDFSLDVALETVPGWVHDNLLYCDSMYGSDLAYLEERGHCLDE